MLCFPNAKINIGLNVIEKRPDSFHNIETIFYPVPLSDILEILKSEDNRENKAEFFLSGREIPGNPEGNLCLKAYRLLDADFDLSPVKIYLHKIVPMGAGLGGGSSDGAFTLRLINDLFELNLSKPQLLSYASQLGSDCAFFIENQPSFGSGKGNILERVSLDLSGYYLILVKPEIFVGTAEAYAGITPVTPPYSLKELANLSVEKWKDNTINDFEGSVFKKHPMIKGIKDKLYLNGALYASMTGSGSAVYGIFKEEISLKEHFKEMFYWQGVL